ncbi:hypothetical protein KIPB_005552 [Kipferlia bialata]|uniref:Uncharacterized protein n=1 Tax=Kipferlia bialata TaxID=797122 RepID=A0A9K3CX93_9EUKA|nr:hypothetical protein KIPB_005552 [Kipferlia bialata]|eukprot:g5552.t1
MTSTTHSKALWLGVGEQERGEERERQSLAYAEKERERLDTAIEGVRQEGERERERLGRESKAQWETCCSEVAGRLEHAAGERRAERERQAEVSNHTLQTRLTEMDSRVEGVKEGAATALSALEHSLSQRHEADAQALASTLSVMKADSTDAHSALDQTLTQILQAVTAEVQCRERERDEVHALLVTERQTADSAIEAERERTDAIVSGMEDRFSALDKTRQTEAQEAQERRAADEARRLVDIEEWQQATREMAQDWCDREEELSAHIEGIARESQRIHDKHYQKMKGQIATMAESVAVIGDNHREGQEIWAESMASLNDMMAKDRDTARESSARNTANIARLEAYGVRERAKMVPRTVLDSILVDATAHCDACTAAVLSTAREETQRGIEGVEGALTKVINERAGALDTRLCLMVEEGVKGVRRDSETALAAATSSLSASVSTLSDKVDTEVKALNDKVAAEGQTREREREADRTSTTSAMERVQQSVMVEVEKGVEGVRKGVAGNASALSTLETQMAERVARAVEGVEQKTSASIATVDTRVTETHASLSLSIKDMASDIEGVKQGHTLLRGVQDETTTTVHDLSTSVSACLASVSSISDRVEVAETEGERERERMDAETRAHCASLLAAERERVAAEVAGVHTLITSVSDTLGDVQQQLLEGVRECGAAQDSKRMLLVSSIMERVDSVSVRVDGVKATFDAHVAALAEREREREARMERETSTASTDASSARVQECITLTQTCTDTVNDTVKALSDHSTRVSAEVESATQTMAQETERLRGEVARALSEVQSLTATLTESVEGERDRQQTGTLQRTQALSDALTAHIASSTQSLSALSVKTQQSIQALKQSQEEMRAVYVQRFKDIALLMMRERREKEKRVEMGSSQQL